MTPSERPSARYPWLDYVWTDVRRNYEYRAWILKRADEDRRLRKHFIERASKDLLWYASTFVWVCDPRMSVGLRDRPFAPFKFQVRDLYEIDRAIDVGYPLIAYKSRDTGYTYQVLIVYDWKCRYAAGSKFLLASCKMERVDVRDDMNALFPRLDFMDEHLPAWLKKDGERYRASTPVPIVSYKSSDGMMTGAASTGDIGAAGRVTSVFFDEFSLFPESFAQKALDSTSMTTRCRIFVGTPKGRNNKFFVLLREGKIRVIGEAWTNHPWQNMGLYQSVGGKVVMLDDRVKLPEDYPYVLDGRVRGPYWDRDEFYNGLDSVRQELGREFLGASGPVFPPEILAIMRSTVRPAHFRGELIFDGSGRPKSFESVDGGNLMLWTPGELGGAPAKGFRYAAGCDVAVGSGDTPSVCAIINMHTGEKVAEYCNNSIPPDRFATYAVALCYWFNNAILNWELQGPGINFNDALEQLGYGNVYMAKPRKPGTLNARLKTMSVSAGYQEVSMIRGTYMKNDVKKQMILNLLAAIRHRTYVERSPRCAREAEQFRYNDKGEIVFMAYRDTYGSGAGTNHADCIMAVGLAMMAAGDRMPWFGDAKRAAIVPERSIGAMIHRDREVVYAGSCMELN